MVEVGKFYRLGDQATATPESLGGEGMVHWHIHHDSCEEAEGITYDIYVDDKDYLPKEITEEEAFRISPQLKALLEAI